MAGHATTAGLGRLGAWLRPRLAAAMLAAIAGLLALAGVGFLAAAAYLALREVLTPWQAAAAIGAALLALALAAVLAVRGVLRPRSGREAGPASAAAGADEHSESSSVAGETLGSALRELGVRRSDLVIGALVAGTVLGASRELRSLLWRRIDGGAPGSAPRPDACRRERRVEPP